MTKLCFKAMDTWEKADGFGCAGLGGLLKQSLDTKSLSILLSGEACILREGKVADGNRMFSKLNIRAK